MTRTLVFEGPRADKRFELLWAALHVSTEKSDRTPASIRKEARLQETLEKVSIATNGSSARVVTGEPTVTVSQEDFEYLQKTTEAVPWTPMASRDVVDLWDWLSVAEKRD